MKTMTDKGGKSPLWGSFEAKNTSACNQRLIEAFRREAAEGEALFVCLWFSLSSEPLPACYCLLSSTVRFSLMETEAKLFTLYQCQQMIYAFLYVLFIYLLNIYFLLILKVDVLELRQRWYDFALFFLCLQLLFSFRGWEWTSLVIDYWSVY